MNVKVRDVRFFALIDDKILPTPTPYHTILGFIFFSLAYQTARMPLGPFPFQDSRVQNPRSESVNLMACPEISPTLSRRPAFPPALGEASLSAGSDLKTCKIDNFGHSDISKGAK
ncbi:MAG: hypothetical protein PHH78_01445 [Methanothrix sp.]|nr:hypothetical protein [Methanothrix harundinacea]MDD3708969.1 hypothetical protein [Methanothrix sp.]